MGHDSFYRHKKILVTGGTGSIGSQIVEQLLRGDPGIVRVLSRDETRQLEFQEALVRRGHALSRMRFLIGDVRDAQRLRRAMEGIDVVFHAAAMKHVPACEYNPFEAVQTNVIGTQNVITAAQEAGVQRVVVISTDKATSPENTMGATKLLSERLVVAAQSSAPGITLSAVRFGNVVGSRGSIAPRVLAQLRDECKAYLTHPEMTRFMMTIQDAVSLVLRAGAKARGGELFILDMPSLRIRDLIDTLIEAEAGRSGRPAASYKVSLIGVRPGEKLHESLVTDDEACRTRVDAGGLYVVEPHERSASIPPRERLTRPLVSSGGPFLARHEIRALLERAGVLGPAATGIAVEAPGALAETYAPTPQTEAIGSLSS